jgi:hypothetical protein
MSSCSVVSGKRSSLFTASWWLHTFDDKWNHPTETRFNQMSCGKIHKIQLCLLCCGGGIKGRRKHLIRFQIWNILFVHWSFGGPLRYYCGPWFSAIHLWPFRNWCGPLQGHMARFENHCCSTSPYSQMPIIMLVYNQFSWCPIYKSIFLSSIVLLFFPVQVNVLFHEFSNENVFMYFMLVMHFALVVPDHCTVTAHPTQYYKPFAKSVLFSSFPLSWPLLFKMWLVLWVNFRGTGSTFSL